MGLKPQLQQKVVNHSLYTVQTVLNVAGGSFGCKINIDLSRLSSECTVLYAYYVI